MAFFRNDELELEGGFDALAGGGQVAEARFVAGEIVMQDAGAADPIGSGEEHLDGVVAFFQLMQGKGALDGELVFFRARRIAGLREGVGLVPACEVQEDADAGPEYG